MLVVTEGTHVEMARNFFLLQFKGVIFMADEFQIGVDVKCGNDASVLIFVDDLRKKPDRESLM